LIHGYQAIRLLDVVFAKNLMEAMIITDPSRRLGSLAEGSKGIFRTTWFDDIDFAKLRRKEIKAPFTPKIRILWTVRTLRIGVI